MRRPLLLLPVLLVGALVGALVSALVAAVPSTAVPDVATKDGRTVLEREVIGRTVAGRPIRAYHLGTPKRRGVETVVLFSTMHGDEPHTRDILRSLVRGPKVRRLDLWVVPTYNPDGLAARTRKNRHGVDLNRNFPYHWADLDGSYESGPRPRSEPETRGAMRFLRRVDPDWVLSFHQPLHGVDTDTKRPAFARRVARALDLPRRRLDCGGVCHGTMTGWFNHHFDGTALTVEYGAHPSKRRMTKIAPDQVLRIFGARRG